MAIHKLIRGFLAGVALLFLAGCPMPFQFTASGYAGNLNAKDPSTPDVTAAPSFSYSSGSGSGVVLDGTTVTTSADTQVTLQTNTIGAVIYYTTDGSAPDPRLASTATYSGAIPIALANPTSTNSSVTETIKATAIGPNMKPSTQISGTVTVQYPQAAPPSFSPAGGTYWADQSVTLSSTTAGSTFYYTVVSGAGPAPQPQPGQAGTTQYSGGIPVTGKGTWTISAITVHSQLINSAASSATFTVDDTYGNTTLAQIVTAVPTMSGTKINNSDTSLIPLGAVFLYVTSSGNYGKMVITNTNIDGNHGLGFQFTTYNAGGTVIASNTAAACNGTYLFDLDYAPGGTESGGTPDFWCENQTSSTRYFTPQNSAIFVMQ